MSKNNNKTKSIIFLCLMLLMSGFLIAACSKADAEDPNKEAIKKVLEHQFTGPDKEFMELLWNPKYRTGVNQENKEFEKYVAEVYGPYFTDSGLDSFIAAFGGTSYAFFTYDTGYKLSFKGVTIEQSEKIPYRYTFITKVGYQKSGGEEKTANVEGEVIFSTKEEGKIGRLQYGDNDGLLDILRTSN
jgi:hypothetical protein